MKQSEKCSIAFTTIQSSIDALYFDSGCFRHMTENRSFFSELKECSFGHVTFGNGAKERIMGKRNIVKQDLPYLNVSQLCD